MLLLYTCIFFFKACSTILKAFYSSKKNPKYICILCALIRTHSQQRYIKVLLTDITIIYASRTFFDT